MIKQIYEFIRHILLNSDTRPSVIACIISAYFWGFLLLLPGQELSRPYYIGLKVISDNELFWGLVFIIFGTFQLIRLIPDKNDYASRSVNLGYIIRFLSCCLWTYITITATFSQYPPPLVIGDTLCIALAAWWDFFRYNGVLTEKSYAHDFKSREK